ncbi:MAG: Wzz/FepE/Etk N-terminal domain-containing protein, partial [bacterium]
MSASVKSTQQPAEQVPVVYAPPPAYWSPPEDDTIDLLELLQTLWRWRWLIVALMVAGLLGSYAVVQVLPKKYTASVMYYAPKGGVSDEIKRVAGDPRFLMSLVQSQNLVPLLFGDALDPVTGQFREANPLS